MQVLTVEELNRLVAPLLPDVPFDRNTRVENDNSHRRARSSRINTTDWVLASRS